MCKFSREDSQKFAPIKNALISLITPGQATMVASVLATLHPIARSTLQQKEEVNRLRYDLSSGLIVSVPRFRDVDFPNVIPPPNDKIRPLSSLSSSTFRLTRTLDILPGQGKYAQAQYEDNNVLEMPHPQLSIYSSRCSRLGLARFICQFFHSISEDEKATRIHTTLGNFELQVEGFRTYVHFLPYDRAGRVHHLSQASFDMVQQSAKGKIRLREEDIQCLFGSRGTSNRWVTASIDMLPFVPDVDHPKCIRFTSLEDIDRLKVIRGFCAKLLDAYVGIVAT